MYLTIYSGPMFSGKTTSLVTYLNDNVKDKSCVYVNHRIDTRSDDAFSSHNKNLSLSKDIKILKVSSLYGMKEYLEKFDIIGIDECQFFDDLFEFVSYCKNKKVKIILSGLCADSNMKEFGKILRCFPLADEINMLYSPCSVCGINTLHTRKRVETDKQIEVGGENLYYPCCKQCF